MRANNNHWHADGYPEHRHQEELRDFIVLPGDLLCSDVLSQGTLNYSLSNAITAAGEITELGDIGMRPIPARRFHSATGITRVVGMNRRAMLALPLLALPPLVPPLLAWVAPRALAADFQLTAQDRADLGRIEAYLNGLHTLKARFLQIAPDGGTSQGIAWLDRPGKMRFQYDRPSPLLLVAGHGLLVYYDRELKQTTNIPLGQTPLGLLLTDQLTLSGDVTVTGIERQPGEIQVTMVRTRSPGDGSLTLVFADNPLALRQWVVVDSQRQETRVSLFDVQLGGNFDPDMFTLVDPKAFPGGDKYYQ
jgi:outer membrane lipoprotein-sorting protein